LALLQAFQTRVRTLTRARLRAEDLHTRGQMRLSDVELLYEALFMNLVRAFESTIEKCFLGLIAGTHKSVQSGVRPIVTTGSIITARRIVSSDRSFLDWLPYENHTRKRADAFFSRGKPFIKLPAQVTRQLTEVLTTRNAIAHESAHAHRQFRRQVLGNLPLLPRERRPAAFLRTIYAHHPAETRFELFAGYLMQAGALVLR
jgi:hypothetical protein